MLKYIILFAKTIYWQSLQKKKKKKSFKLKKYIG